MKRKILSALLIAAMSLTFSACSFIEDAFGQKNEQTMFGADQVTSEGSDSADVTTPAAEESNEEGSEGGNPDISKYIDVTVSEDKYFYDNKEISLEDFLKVLEGIDANTAVKITDENATLKAFEELTKALLERKIPYEAAN
ncbi:MAG: hypothetical protein HDT44_01565 [Ruminococcaceae bacterium]|nr:hypothetical protein [Oscillospiraceae bacterium]